MAWNNIFKKIHFASTCLKYIVLTEGFCLSPITMLTFTLSYKAKMKHAELIKTCTSFPGGGGVTVNLFWFHWISNFQLKPVPGQSSPEAPARTHMLSLVCTRDICIHGQLQTPNFSPFFSTELLFFFFFFFQRFVPYYVRQYLPYLSSSQLAAEELSSVGLNSQMLTQRLSALWRTV